MISNKMLINLKKIYKIDFNKFLFTIVTSLSVMLIAHAFAFSNLMYSHDSLGLYYYSALDKASIGRWMFIPYILIRGKLITPWLSGVLCIFYMIISMCIIQSLFNLKKICITCFIFVMTTNITVSSLIATYIHDADADILAILFSCIAVFSREKLPRILNILVSSLFICLSMGFYQSYIGFSTTLFVLLIIYNINNNEKFKNKKYLLKYVSCDILCIILGGVLYLFFMYQVIDLYSISLASEYNGPQKLHNLTIEYIIGSIPKAYTIFYNNIFVNKDFNTFNIDKISFLCLFLVFVYTVYNIIKNYKTNICVYFIMPLLVIIPICMNCIYFVSFGMMHDLMTYSDFIFYILPIFVISKYNNLILNKIIQIITLCICFIVFINNIITSNSIYTYKNMLFNNTSVNLTYIYNDINNVHGYDPNSTQVVFIGDPTKSAFSINNVISRMYDNKIVGLYNCSVTYPTTINVFYESILGKKLRFISDDKKIKEIAEIEEVRKMPIYPQKGYCKIVKDILVVKISK